MRCCTFGLPLFLPPFTSPPFTSSPNKVCAMPASFSFLRHKKMRPYLSLLGLFFFLFPLLFFNGLTLFCLRLDPFADLKLRDKTPMPLPWLPSSSSVMRALQEGETPPLFNQNLRLLHPDRVHQETLLSVFESFDKISVPASASSSANNSRMLKFLQQSTPKAMHFSARAKVFFSNNNASSCPKAQRFFMTWISPLELLGRRELFTVESIFKSHPNACLLIISHSMDSRRGTALLEPFLSRGFRVAALSPNFTSILEGTSAESWFDRLKGGSIPPGEVSLGQNLSNLLRLALLYKFGGVYVDADVLVLKSFSTLRNSIGAQTVEPTTGNWSRLNNAVMVFDKKHPLLRRFIEEFTLTFNGNKWGHNGPYLVSRVVARERDSGLNFRVLPQNAFYPVGWGRIETLFHGPRSEVHSKWALGKLHQIRKESFAIHLWNRQSRSLKVEQRSVISQLMLDSCIFCKSLVSMEGEGNA